MTRQKQLKADIEELISHNLPRSAFDINVEVDEKGNVLLHGMVDSLAEKEFIEKIVKRIPEVRGIENGLTIAVENLFDDQEIVQILTDKFQEEPELDTKKIGVECKKGTVFLRGRVSSKREMELAKEIAAEVPGVKEVKSLVEFIDKEEIDDVSIVNRVEVAFSVSKIVEAEDIKTACRKGVVTLEGIVDNNKQKQAAETIAETVPGVRKVINKLITRHDNVEGDKYLTNMLRKALNKDPRVSPAQVKAYVINGTAYLSGKVYNIDNKKAAEEVARELKGINQVVNDVTVAYH